jgi:hypothetical protein
MLKKTIRYTNFNEEEKELVAYFHLGKADLTRIAADASFLEEMEAAFKSKDTKVMLAKIEHMVRLSYGIRSEDSERFIRTPEIQESFIQSAAYEEFVVSLLTEEGAMINFFKSVFPAKAIKEIQAMVDQGKVPDPFGDPNEVIKNAAALSEQKVEVDAEGSIKDDRPAWMREHRAPSRKELREMTKEEMMRAFAQYPSLAFEAINEPD